MYPCVDAEPARQVGAVKVEQNGESRTSVYVSIKNGANCEFCLFFPFSITEKYGANPQPIHFSASQAARQHFFFFFLSLHGAKHSCCCLAAPSAVASASPPLRAYGYSPIFAAAAASASLCGYTPSVVRLGRNPYTVRDFVSPLH